MKIRVICKNINGYNTFIVQQKGFMFWFDAFYYDRYRCMHTFKSGISAEAALEKFHEYHRNNKTVVSVAIEEHEYEI